MLLASRLESNEKVFGLVLFALELFAFFPLARWEPALVVHGIAVCWLHASCLVFANSINRLYESTRCTLGEKKHPQKVTKIGDIRILK